MVKFKRYSEIVRRISMYEQWLDAFSATNSWTFTGILILSLGILTTSWRL